MSKNVHEIMRELAPYMNLGWQMVVTIAVFGGIGWLLDKYFETGQLWLVVFLVIGAIAALTNFLRQALAAGKKKSI